MKHMKTPCVTVGGEPFRYCQQVSVDGGVEEEGVDPVHNAAGCDVTLNAVPQAPRPLRL